MPLLTAYDRLLANQVGRSSRCGRPAVLAVLHAEGVGPCAEGEPLASGECTAFARWVDDLPAEGAAAIKQLGQGGFAFDLDCLEAQLRRALDNPAVEPTAQSVGRRLLGLLARRGKASSLLVDPVRA